MINTQNQPRVSIIIVAYNAEKTVERAIKSACAQTTKEIEIICVNDGSTDSTDAIMRECAAQDKRIKVITQPNMGTLGARTVGIREATGLYTMFLDSDDCLLPEAVQTACDTIEKLGVDVLEFGVNVIEDPVFPQNDERVVWRKAYYSQECSIPDDAHGVTLVNACFGEQTITWVLWTKLWRTEQLQDAVKYYSGEWLCVSEDQLIIQMVLLFTKRYARITTKLYSYYAGNGTTTKGEKFTDSATVKVWGTKWLALTLARQWLERRGCSQEEIASGTAAFARHIQNDTILDLINQCAPEYRSEYLGWLSQSCTKEEFIDVVSAAIERQGKSKKSLDWYKNSYETISNSTCWKITAPIRFVLDKLKGVKREK